MKFSIITPSFNQVSFIEETIDSVLSQGVELEYWVIDGGSTDGTVDILKKYAKRYKNFFYVSEKDRGQSHAINKGIARSEGDMVAYLNSDDVYLPGALKNVKEYSERYPKSGWFYGRSQLVDEQGAVIKQGFTQVKNFLGKEYAYWKLLCVNIISQPAVFLRREIFQIYGVFDERHHLVMDYEFWLRIGRGHPPVSIKDNLSQFRVHTNSKTSVNFFKIYRDAFLVSLRYQRPRYWHCAVIHLASFLAAVVWMKFIKF